MEPELQSMAVCHKIIYIEKLIIQKGHDKESIRFYVPLRKCIQKKRKKKKGEQIVKQVVRYIFECVEV